MKTKMIINNMSIFNFSKPLLNKISTINYKQPLLLIITIFLFNYSGHSSVQKALDSGQNGNFIEAASELNKVIKNSENSLKVTTDLENFGRKLASLMFYKTLLEIASDYKSGNISKDKAILYYKISNNAFLGHNSKGYDLLMKNKLNQSDYIVLAP